MAIHPEVLWAQRSSETEEKTVSSFFSYIAADRDYGASHFFYIFAQWRFHFVFLERCIRDNQPSRYSGVNLKV